MGEISKVEAYIDRVVAAVERIGLYPRTIDRYPFDTIACSMISKSVALARSCISLMRAGHCDEAYGLSRSVVECALILRYITSEKTLQGDRAKKFIMFSREYKNVWLYHARNEFADQPEIVADVERHARVWDLNGDPKKAKQHWSQLRAFTWDAQSLVHPLDGPSFDSGFKEKQYAVDYFQTCQWVHCSQPALDNYVPVEGSPFRITNSSDEFGSPGHSVLYILVNYLHSTICYALYGMGVSRPAEIGPAFHDTIREMKPVGSGNVFVA